MASNNYYLGDLIIQRREKNPGGDLPIRGVSKEGLQPPKQIDADTSIYNLYYRNDFVYNPARMELGSIAFNDEYDKAICSSLYEVFYVNRTDLLLPEYLALFVKHPEFARYCNYIGNGSAREYCRFENISGIPIHLPSLSEQRKIVHDYAVITKRIEVLKKINENLEAQNLSIYRAYFVDYEMYSGEMPDGWERTTVGNVSSVTRGASPRPIDEFMSLDGMPWVKISDASASFSKYLFDTAECIIDEGVEKSRLVTPKTMIVSNSASPGLPMLMETTACVHDGWLILGNFKRVSQEFMYYFFIHERKSLVSESNGSVFNNLKTDIVKEYPIVIPDAETMEKVTGIFRSYNKVILSNAKEYNALIELRRIVLSQVIS